MRRRVINENKDIVEVFPIPNNIPYSFSLNHMQSITDNIRGEIMYPPYDNIIFGVNTNGEVDISVDFGGYYQPGVNLLSWCCGGYDIKNVLDGGIVCGDAGSLRGEAYWNTQQGGGAGKECIGQVNDKKVTIAKITLVDGY